MKRSVLTIVHVFEILLAVRNGKSWTDAFLSVLPSRANAVAIAKNSETTYTNENLEKENTKST